MERKCSPEEGREGGRAAGPGRAPPAPTGPSGAAPARPIALGRGGHPPSLCLPLPPLLARSVSPPSLPPAPYGFSPPPPPLLPPPCCLRDSPHSTLLLRSPGERFPAVARRGPAEGPARPGPAAVSEGSAGPAWSVRGTLRVREGREEGCQPKLPAKLFPGCAVEELEEVHLSPNTPPLLVLFFSPPLLPPPPSAATRSTRHSEINIIHLHQKKPREL